MLATRGERGQDQEGRLLHGSLFAHALSIYRCTDYCQGRIDAPVDRDAMRNFAPR
jgi:hypothetical protein